MYIPSKVSTSFSRFDAFNQCPTNFVFFPTNSSILNFVIESLKWLKENVENHVVYAVISHNPLLA